MRVPGSSQRKRNRLVGATLVAVVVILPACVNVFTRIAATEVTPPRDDQLQLITTPLKAHLQDGGTVIFAGGARIGKARIVGAGTRYALLSSEGTYAQSVTLPTDSVVGLETFERGVNTAPTVMVSTAATAVGVVATVALLKALFGSCPTVYVDTGTGPVLQAEGFSYSIAPLLERPDLDALRLPDGVHGIVRLELRNEALETHYLNHVALIAARHRAGEVVVPDQRSRPVVVGALRPLTRAVDRAGRDVRAELADADGRLFATAPATLAGVRSGDMDDWIDLEADGLPPGDSIAVVLRLRNSLLNTVLLYDQMLSGPEAAGWLGTGLRDVPTAMRLAGWYTETMGMHFVVNGVPLPAVPTVAREHARLPDAGPIAFRDVAVVLPRPATGASRVSVRLRFVADNWRIDQARIADVVRRPETRAVAISRVVVPTPAVGVGPVPDSAAVRMLAGADRLYLETRPGQRMWLEFDVGGVTRSADERVTYLLDWQGWYREWLRTDWVMRPRPVGAFAPGDAAMLEALSTWRTTKDALERKFYASRIPVR